MKVKALTIDIILTLVVIAGLVSFFYNPLGQDMKYLQILMGSIIGFFIGLKEIPVMRAIQK
jgi:hypothetical protein